MKVLIKYYDLGGGKREEVHYDGPFEDVTLCGDEMAGESPELGEEGWDDAIPTSKPVTCSRCLAIVQYVREDVSERK